MEMDYDIRVFDDPSSMREALREKHIGWRPADVLFPAHLLGDNPLLTKAVTLVCCGIITRTHRVYWFLLSEKIGNCKQRQDQNMANSMIVLLVNVL